MCDINGCNEPPLWEDEMQNEYCEDCHTLAISRDGKDITDFEPIE